MNHTPPGNHPSYVITTHKNDNRPTSTTTGAVKKKFRPTGRLIVIKSNRTTASLNNICKNRHLSCTDSTRNGKDQHQQLQQPPATTTATTNLQNRHPNKERKLDDVKFRQNTYLLIMLRFY